MLNVKKLEKLTNKKLEQPDEDDPKNYQEDFSNIQANQRVAGKSPQKLENAKKGDKTKNNDDDLVDPMIDLKKLPANERRKKLREA